MVKSLEARIEEELNRLRELDQIRILKPRRGIDFSSNDYFCLTQHPAIIASVKDSIRDDGYGSSSSRFIRGETEKYHKVETKLAQFKLAEKALLFANGYAANIGALSSIIKKGDVVFSDRLNHASLIDGLRLTQANICIFPHCDVDTLTKELRQAPKDVQKFIVTESVFSMDGDMAPLDIYADFVDNYDLGLIVDEAHAIGLYGKNGAGLIDHFGVSDRVLFSTNGLGKAFGCYGAFVAGANNVIDIIMQTARSLMFSTALPPLAITAIDTAADIIASGDDLRQKLFAHVEYFNHAFEEIKGFSKSPSPIFPIIVGDNMRAKIIAENLQARNFDIKGIRPPTVPTGTARLRITTNLSHTTDLIDNLREHLRELL